MQKHTKKALLASVLSLILCVSMLIGTTFAWFTDSVTTGVNIIKSGNLDVTMEWMEGTKNPSVDSADWKDASDAVLFSADTLWEPGYTEVRHIKISNEGNLALRYKLNIVAGGSVTDLAKVIDVYYADPAVALDARSALSDDAIIGNLADVLENLGSDNSTAAGNLLPDESVIVTVALKMQESAGNEYQAMSLFEKNDEAKGFALQLLATQYTYENDSFGDEYDDKAEFPVVFTDVINASTPAADIVRIFKEGGTVLVEESVDLANVSGSKYLDVNGDVDLYLEDGVVVSFSTTTIFSGNGTVSVTGGSLKTPQELCVSGNTTLVINSGEHTFGAFSATSDGKIIVNGGTLNCKGTYGNILGITFGENGTLIVNDGTLNMDQPFNLNPNRCDNAYIEINGGTINLSKDIDKLFAVRNIMDKDLESGVLRGSSIKITGGVFNAPYERDNTGDANAFIRNEDGSCDTTRVLAGNVYNGEKQYDCIVTGGTFYGDWARTGETGTPDFCENTIAGFVADGYRITGDATNGYVISK